MLITRRSQIRNPSTGHFVLVLFHRVAEPAVRERSTSFHARNSMRRYCLPSEHLHRKTVFAFRLHSFTCPSPGWQLSPFGTAVSESLLMLSNESTIKEEQHGEGIEMMNSLTPLFASVWIRRKKLFTFNCRFRNRLQAIFLKQESSPSRPLRICSPLQIFSTFVAFQFGKDTKPAAKETGHLIWQNYERIRIDMLWSLHRLTNLCCELLGYSFSATNWMLNLKNQWWTD